MPHFVYIIKTISGKSNKTYVGYSKNVSNRLKLHNLNKGAKSTKGHKWEVIYKKKFVNKSDALKYEYNLKKNRKERLNIIQKNT
jgi:putative endonuclease